MCRSILKAAFAGAALASSLGFAANAGTVDIGLQQAGVNGGAITTVATGTNNAGVVGLPYGTFTLNNVSGTGDGALVFPDLLNSNALNTSTSLAPGVSSTLNVWVTITGITAPIGAVPFVSSFTQNVLSNGWSVTENTFVDAGNTAYGTTTPLSSHTFTTIGSALGSNVATVGPGPYSITEEYVVNALGPGSSNATIDVSAVPEPSTWAMMLLGFLGLAFAFHQSRRKVSFA